MNFGNFVIKGRALHLNELEFPSPKEGISYRISWQFRNKGRGPSFEKTLNSLHPKMFVPSLVEIGSVVLEKKIF